MTAKEAPKEVLEAYTEYVRRSIIRSVIPLIFETWSKMVDVVPAHDTHRSGDGHYPGLPFHP